VVSAVAAALGLAVTVDAKADLRRIVDFLCGRSTLLVLDNCEQVIEAAAQTTQDLLELCPTLRVLATSREALGVPSEVMWPVPPLSPDDAIALFVERASASSPKSDLSRETEQTTALLRSICLRLDGLPLAIELAASRLSAMPLRELAAGLDDRFRLLNRGARTAHPRQQTLRAVVDWSYDLLFEDERRVLDRLSVFTGGCELVAARMVCADDNISEDDVTELITRLAEKSLITIEDADEADHVRCRMLQTLADYGKARLAASGDEARVRGTHARYFCELAERSVAALRGEQQRSWLRVIASNMGNLRAVLDAAVAAGDAETAYRVAGALGWYWWFTGRAIEGSGWLRLAHTLHMTEGVTRARLLAWTAFTRRPGFVSWADPGEPFPAPVAADRDSTDDLCDEAISMFLQAGEHAELIGIETALAVAYSSGGDHLGAARLLGDADQQLARIGSAPWITAMRAYVRARRAFVEDRFQDAEAAFRASIPLFEAIGGEVHCTFAYRYIGRLAALRGDHDASISAIKAAVHLARELGLSAFASVLLTDLGASLAVKGDCSGAREALEQTLSDALDQRAPSGIAESMSALAWVEWGAEHTTEAARLAAEALHFATKAENHDAVSHCSVLLGLAAEHRGDLVEARAHHRHGLEAARKTGEPRRLALALKGLAALAAREGDGCAAARLGGAAATLKQSPGRATGSAFALVDPIDANDLMSRATQSVGVAEAAAAHASGARDPHAVIAGLATAPA
jgi:predicted ATPase